MVIASQETDCPVCDSKNVVHRIHEAFFGVRPKTDCVVCIMLQAIENEWPQLHWRRKPNNTFVINTTKFRRGT